MESTGDKIRAFLLALGVHVVCVLLLFLGLTWSMTAQPVSVPGPIVEATLMAYTPPAKAAAPKPQPKREPPAPPPVAAPPPAPEPTPETEPVPPRAEDTVDQERIDREALEVAENAEKEQEERIKREQLLLQEQERLARVERERQQQLDDIKKLREEAEKKRRLEQEKLAQLEDSARREAEEDQREAEAERMKELLAQEQSQPAVQAGNEGTDDSLAARYAFAIQTAVTQNWLRPDTVVEVRCRVRIIQIPGGEVISAEVVPPCNADDITQRSLEAAVMRAQPLPYQGYESVFQRQINFNFCYPRTLCQG